MRMQAAGELPQRLLGEGLTKRGMNAPGLLGFGSLSQLGNWRFVQFTCRHRFHEEICRRDDRASRFVQTLQRSTFKSSSRKARGKKTRREAAEGRPGCSQTTAKLRLAPRSMTARGAKSQGRNRKSR